jgi:hypothetical protein
MRSRGGGQRFEPAAVHQNSYPQVGDGREFLSGEFIVAANGKPPSRVCTPSEATGDRPPGLRAVRPTGLRRREVPQEGAGASRLGRACPVALSLASEPSTARGASCSTRTMPGDPPSHISSRIQQGGRETPSRARSARDHGHRMRRPQGGGQALTRHQEEEARPSGLGASKGCGGPGRPLPRVPPRTRDRGRQTRR